MLERAEIGQQVVVHLEDWKDYLRCLGAMPQDVDEVVQEACVAILSQDTLPVALAAFPAYVRGMLRHLLHRRWRDRRRHQGRFDDRWQAVAELAWQEAAVDPDRLAGQERLRAGLQRCVQLLPPRSREILAWRYQAGWAAQAIADRLHSTAEAVRARLLRLRAALRRCVEAGHMEAEHES